MSAYTYLVCPSCGTKNRIPTERIGKKPKCGKCKTKLFAVTPFDLDEPTLNKLLESDDVPLLVDFWAPWCGPCRMMAPMFAEASKELSPTLRFAKLNTEVVPAVGERFAIKSIPLMILFHKGREIARSAGALDAKGIIGWVKANMPD